MLTRPPQSGPPQGRPALGRALPGYIALLPGANATAGRERGVSEVPRSFKYRLLLGALFPLTIYRLDMVSRLKASTESQSGVSVFL